MTVTERVQISTVSSQWPPTGGGDCREETDAPMTERSRSTDHTEPPLVLVACALLWIGIAIGLYLPTVWVNIAITAISVVAITAYIDWRIRRRREASDG